MRTAMERTGDFPNDPERIEVQTPSKSAGAFEVSGDIWDLRRVVGSGHVAPRDRRDRHIRFSYVQRHLMKNRKTQ